MNQSQNSAQFPDNNQQNDNQNNNLPPSDAFSYPATNNFTTGSNTGVNPFSPQNNSDFSTPQPAIPTKSTKQEPNFFSKAATFFKIIGIILILLILALTSIFVYIIINPNSAFSASVAGLPLIRDYISLPNQSDTSQSSNSSDSKPGNQLLGLEQNSPASTTFATPGDAKTTTEVVSQVLPSVFSLTISQPNSRFAAAGTGYVVTKDGIIITNKHVIASACQSSNSQIQIQASSVDDKMYDLQLLSVDPVYDLAILKVKNTEDEFKPLQFANPKDIKLGMEVLAIGNALGEFQNTVTKGIVSGVNRNLETGLTDECSGKNVVADGLIQTDAAINQGNSGGPLFNASGQVIGMNTFGTQGAENIGLAVPSSIILSALNSYVENQKIIRPRIGVVTEAITPVTKIQNPWIPIEYGEILFAGSGVETVLPDSAAAKAGLKTGDILLSINGEDLRATSSNSAPLRSKLISLKAGQKVTFLVLKANSPFENGFKYAQKPEEVTVTLGEISFDLK